jgi:hypothetical protein
MAFIVGRSARASKRPCSAMSFVARMSPPQAPRASAPPVEMRLTPRSSSWRLTRERRGKAIAHAAARSNFFWKFLDKRPGLWHSKKSLDERRLTRRRKAAATASHGSSEGIRLKGRVREILVRHEGLAPVCLSKSSKPVGLFRADAILASHRIDRLSYPRFGLFARTRFPSSSSAKRRPPKLDK